MCHFLDVNVSVPKGLCQPVSFQRALLPQLPTCVFVEHMRQPGTAQNQLMHMHLTAKHNCKVMAPGNVYHGLCIRILETWPGDLAAERVVLRHKCCFLKSPHSAVAYSSSTSHSAFR